ncbi:MAG TPA: hypothetical protein VF916_01100, partial [Ktedonobacterales bacterium]
MCAGVGALVGTTGANSFNYVLTATSLLNPALPCEGAQAAFQQLYGPGQGWALIGIEVWLGTAYTGSAANQIGTIRFKSDPAQITTNVSLFTQKLVALPLTPLSGAPSHDLPVLQVPQPSDPPVGPSQTVLDLGNGGAEPIGRDSLNSNEEPSTLVPVSLSADALNQEVLPTPTQPPTVTPPQQTVVGGTVVPTQPPAGGPTAQATPSALSSKVSVGAPVVNENGALVGMVIADDAGAHVIAPLSQVTEGISSVSGKPGPIMTQWKTGLTAFYAAPPAFVEATTAWTSLLGTAPDFAGIAPYLTAAKARSTDVTPPASSGSPTVSPTASTSPGQPSTSISLSLLVTLVGFVLFVVLLAVALLVMRLVRGAARRRRKPEPVAPEAGGQLPPVSVPLGLPEAGPQPNYSDAMDALPILPQQAVSVESAETPPPDAISEQATETLATVTLPTAPVAPLSRGARLVPQAAGLTNPGRRRAADPNQDNILAATGTYTGGGSPQPFGLFIVADGMGGHADGKEASRRTIEVMAGHVIPALTRG